MSRINTAFANKAKVAYLTAGDGGVDKSVENFLALVKGGVNLLEVGIPYSDPVADGPVIQAAMERALKEHHTTVDTSLEIVSKIRNQDDQVAIILFTYYNPIQANLAEFIRKVKDAGADGVLVVDLPYEEAGELRHWCKVYGVSPITVVAPSTTQKRIKTILAGLDNGFVYYACQKGTTGTRDGLPEDLATHLDSIREVTKLPIAVGFGVSNSQMVADILKVADGCVVGSYLVKQIANHVTPAELTKITQGLYNVA